MNLKLINILWLLVLAPVLFSACTSAESKEANEVVINSKSNDSGEVYITNADIKEQTEQVSTRRSFDQPEKKVLSDKSEIETIVDEFGNKIETRHFPEHPRLKMLILRTSADGKRMVSVYGQGDESKRMPELAGRALTATADEIADAAGLSTATIDRAAKNFMKLSPADSQTPLQPLPSSEFQKPAVQYNPPVETTQPEPVEKNETPAEPSNPDEN